MKTEYRVLIIVVLGVLLLVLGASAMKKNNVSLSGPNSTILFLTQPVKTFSGMIEKIDGDTLTVTQKVTFRVITDKNTVIEQPESPIPYLFAKSMNATNKKKTIKDLKIGQAVVINTDEDLRTVTSQEFKATRVTLNAIMNTLSGPVFDVNGNTLIIKTIPPFTPVSETPKERNYRIKITNNTEISRSALDGTPVRLTLNDLKRNMWVVAYTDGDVNLGTDFTALRIDPSISVEAPIPTASPTSAPLPTVSSASPSSNTR